VRIIGGLAGGKLLAAPRGLSVRPTPDKARQAIFNSLGTRVEDAEVLDLFSGTGALGLECLSRGARHVVSVEASSRHAHYIRANLERLDLDRSRHELRVQDAFAALRHFASLGRSFDLILADPPFGPKTQRERSRSLSQQLLDSEDAQRVLRNDGLFILGHARRDAVAVPDLWSLLRALSHGDSMFLLLRLPEPETATKSA
jgi:16S rRNA (guanine966-N2)-methyltransferase